MAEDDESLCPTLNVFVHSQLDRLDSLDLVLNSSRRDEGGEGEESVAVAAPQRLTFTKASRRARKEIMGLADEVETRLVDLSTSLSLIDRMEEEISGTVVTQHSAIIEAFEEMKRKIEERKLDLIEKFNQMTALKLESLGQQRKRIERDMECIENSVSVSRSLVKHATDQQMETHRKRITDHLIRVKDSPSLLQPPAETSHVELSINLFDEIRRIASVGRIEEVQTKQSFVAAFIDYKSSSAPKMMIGTKGPGKVQLFFPSGICVDNNNHTIVVDTNGHKVCVFDAENNLITSFGQKGFMVDCIQTPYGVATDKNNNIFVCDTGNHRIQVFDTNGNRLRSFGSYGDRPHQFKGPTGIAIDSENNFVISDSFGHRVQIFDPEGNPLRSFGSSGSADGHFGSIWGLAIDPETQNIAVCDPDHHRVQVFDRHGSHLFTIGKYGKEDGQMNGPRGVAIDGKGNIIVCELGGNRIQIFDRCGRHIHTFGSRGSSPGQFECPNFVALDHKGNILVSDSGNGRIQIF